MKFSVRKLSLAAGMILIFVAGSYYGRNFQQTKAPADAAPINQDSSTQEQRENPNGSARVSSTGQSEKKPKKPLELSLQVVLEKIQQAKLLPAGSRTTPLLKALEESSKLPLSKELLNELNAIISEGELETSNYVISLVEQREDKAAVDFLLNTSANSNADVAQRALFALEAVAGNVFQTRDAAVTWAATWQPDPERAKLFSPGQGSENDNTTDAIPRLPGPAGRVK